MASLNKVMTAEEAQCFRTLRRWQRVDLRKRLFDAIFPKFKILSALRKSSAFVKCVCASLLILSSPLLVVIWLLNIARVLLMYPFLWLLSYTKPSGLRAPGERNIKGLHYQFAKHVTLPPELYIQCIDDWISILYGANKLPKYSIKSYLDTSYLLQRKVAVNDASALNTILRSQISNAREDLSRDLGCY